MCLNKKNAKPADSINWVGLLTVVKSPVMMINYTPETVAKQLNPQTRRIVLNHSLSSRHIYRRHPANSPIFNSTTMGGGSVSSDPKSPESSAVDSPPSPYSITDTVDSEVDSAAVGEAQEHDDATRRRRRRGKTYGEVLSSYQTAAEVPVLALQQAKDAILSHVAGNWIEEVAGTKRDIDYQVPDTITLLVLGPEGSGKSSLINRISRLLENVCDPHFLPDRAQVSNNLVSGTPGSCFLQEYLIPRLEGTPSFCMYDTRGLSMVPADNFKLLKKWMTEGVTHGDMIIRDSDDEATKKRIKAMARQGFFSPCQKRRVNFVLFVIDGASVLKSMNSEDAQYKDMLVETFNYPFLSFKDNKPVVVVTHGDELSLTDRARVCTHLGDLLGIPPTQQIFDIPVCNNPRTSDYVTEVAIVRMLWYSIEQADRSIPYTQNYLLEAPKMTLRIMDRLQGFDVWRPILELVLFSLAIIILIFRVLYKS